LAEGPLLGELELDGFAGALEFSESGDLAVLDFPAVEAAAEFGGPVFFGAGHEDLAVGGVNTAKEGEEAGAAVAVEFAHDVVNEEDGGGAVDGGEVFGLGDFKGDGGGALLAFAAVLGKGTGSEGEVEFVAVGAEKSHAGGAVAGEVLAEEDGEVARSGGGVVEPEFFGGGARDTLAGLAGEGGQGGEDLAAVFDELGAGGGEFGSEGLEGGGIEGTLLEEGVAGAEGAGVALEKGEVGRDGLGEEEVEVAAAAAGGAFDELEVFGAKDDGAEGTKVVGEFADGAGIQRKVFLARGPVELDFTGAGMVDGGPSEEAGLAVADEMGRGDAAEGAKGGEEVERLEEVGFALGVAAEEEVKAGVEGGIEPGVIAKIAEAQLAQMHEARMGWMGRFWKEEWNWQGGQWALFAFVFVLCGGRICGRTAGHELVLSEGGAASAVRARIGGDS